MVILVNFELTVVVGVMLSMFKIDMRIAPVALFVLELSVELVLTVITVDKSTILTRTLPVSWYLHWISITMSTVVFFFMESTIMVLILSTEPYCYFSMNPMSMFIFELTFEHITMHFVVL